jgi:hypothetical protein
MGAVFALFAGFYYWTPKIVGRNVNDLLGKIHFWTLFLGVNLTFFPQHFLGMAGVLFLFFKYVDLLLMAPVVDTGSNNLYIYLHILSLLPITPTEKPFGPHISPKFIVENKPVKVYKPNLDRNLIGRENKNQTLIYQWINLINSKIYVGSA